MNINKCVRLFCSEVSSKPDGLIELGTFTRYLIHNEKYTSKSFYSAYIKTQKRITECLESNMLNSFENKILSTSRAITETDVTIQTVDMMDGLEFELFVSKLFKKLGYSVSMTKRTGDQGIDIIAEKNNERIGVQAKCYSGTVSNSAIQEVVAGVTHYKCNKAVVITNSIFTQSAIDLGISNRVVMWDRNVLKEKLAEHF